MNCNMIMSYSLMNIDVLIYSSQFLSLKDIIGHMQGIVSFIEICL